MTFQVLVKKLCVTKFSQWPYSDHFVVKFLVMNQFMSGHTADRGEKADYEGESEIITIGFWSLNSVEKITLWVDVVTHYDKCPNRNEIIKNDKNLKWKVKPFILGKRKLRFWT